MKRYLPALALLATACGAQEPALPQAQNEAPRNTRQMPIPSESAAPGAAWSLKAASPDKLPECTPDTEGCLAWVVSEKTAYACSEAAWLPLDLRGRDGKDGQTVVGEKGEKGDRGEAGPQGERGERGEQGLQGVAGADGLNGADGADGRDGRDGIDGRDGRDGITTTVTEVRRMEHLPKARDAQGVAIGDVIYYDTSRSHFIAVTPVGLRLRFTSLGGIPTWTVYYKTANCSDTPLVLAEPYFFETVFSTVNGLMVKDGAAANHTAAYRRRGPDMPCELAPSVVTARMFSLRAPTTTEATNLWNFGLTYVD